MENSFRFYNNKSCQYLPCHKVDNVDEFNCMFCYCPLYLMDECGGKYKINYGIKDCSDCIIPHKPNGYDYINKKLIEVNDKKMEEFIKSNHNL